MSGAGWRAANAAIAAGAIALSGGAAEAAPALGALAVWLVLQAAVGGRLRGRAVESWAWAGPAVELLLLGAAFRASGVTRPELLLAAVAPAAAAGAAAGPWAGAALGLAAGLGSGWLSPAPWPLIALRAAVLAAGAGAAGAAAAKGRAVAARARHGRACGPRRSRSSSPTCSSSSGST